MKNYRYSIPFVVLLSFCSSVVWGNEFRIAPSVSVNNTYNSNILLSAEEIKSDYVTVLSPGVEMVNRTGRFNTNLLLRWDRLDYADNRDLGATNQMYNGKFQYLAMPLLSISAEVGYMKNANPAFYAGSGSVIPPGTIIPAVSWPESPASPGSTGSGQAGPAPEGTSASPAAIPVIAAPWNHITSSLSARYPVTEKTTAAVSYSYGRDYYENQRYQDGMSHDINTGLEYDIGQYFPAVKGRLNMGYSYYNFPDSRNDSFMNTVGFSWDFTEVWNILLDGGIRRTWSEVFVTKLVPYGSSAYLAVRERSSNNGWSEVGRMSLSYKGEYGNGDLTYNRDLTLASGLNGAAEHNALTLSSRHQFTHELSVLLTTGLDSYKSDPSNFSAHVINQQTFFINPGVRYEFSKDKGIEASYAYTRVNGTTLNTVAKDGSPGLNMDTDRQFFSIRLYAQQSFLE
jgi:hypothetical protein